MIARYSLSDSALLVYCSPTPASAESKERVARRSDLDARRLPLSVCSLSRLFSAWMFLLEEGSLTTPVATSKTRHVAALHLAAIGADHRRLRLQLAEQARC